MVLFNMDIEDSFGKYCEQVKGQGHEKETSHLKAYGYTFSKVLMHVSLILAYAFSMMGPALKRIRSK